MQNVCIVFALVIYIVMFSRTKAYFPLGDFIRATRSENKNSATSHWLTFVGEKIRREQVGTVPTFFLFVGNGLHVSFLDLITR